MNETVDVLIIGSGASGAAVAWSLAETRMRILCLEQGDWMRHSDFPSHGRDWEARRYSDFDISPNRRARPTDYPINDDNSPMKIANFNGVGGGTIMYTAHFPRMHPSDFRVRSLDGVADDWPVDYPTLEPFFAENDRMMGVSGLAGDPAYPPKQPLMPPLPLGKTGARYARAMNRLGWHWWPSDTTIATTEYDGRAPCINVGHCTPGCAQGAKASTDITYWPHAIRAGVELRPRCRVREITTNEHGMAAGAIYYDATGVERFQPAEVVILACNGIGTPRLLLNSASPRFPDGLANSSGLVGKNLMLHPWPQVRGYVDESVDGDRAPMLSLRSKEFYETDPARDFVRGYTLQFARGAGVVSEAIASEAAGRLPWGEDHHRIYRHLPRDDARTRTRLQPMPRPPPLRTATSSTHPDHQRYQPSAVAIDRSARSDGAPLSNLQGSSARANSCLWASGGRPGEECSAVAEDGFHDQCAVQEIIALLAARLRDQQAAVASRPVQRPGRQSIIRLVVCAYRIIRT
jgi:choline dehydrogenase-like flavoprotein